jgi:hypothetical protein
MSSEADRITVTVGTVEAKTVMRDGAVYIGTVPAGYVMRRFGDGWIAVDPARPPLVIDPSGVRSLIPTT